MLAVRSFVIDISQCLRDSNFLLYKVAAEVNVSGKESINPKIVRDKLVNSRSVFVESKAIYCKYVGKTLTKL